MQKALEHTGVTHRVSPATVELLVRERNNGKTLRQLGQMFGRSYEWVRQVLAKYDPPQEPLLSELSVAAKLGYPVVWLARLRKEGLTSPINRGRWLYSEEQIKQISLLIAERRKCEQCGKPRSPGSQRFCKECNQYRKRHRYRYLNPEKKARHIERCLAWRKANPERGKAIRIRANRKYLAKVRRGLAP